jgi:hypothetical protein
VSGGIAMGIQDFGLASSIQNLAKLILKTIAYDDSLQKILQNFFLTLSVSPFNPFVTECGHNNEFLIAVP